jgi:hypothetical protein
VGKQNYKMVQRVEEECEALLLQEPVADIPWGSSEG